MSENIKVEPACRQGRADAVLNIKEFTIINDCFQYKSNEEIGVFWRTLFRINNFLKSDRRRYYYIYVFIIAFLSLACDNEEMDNFNSPDIKKDVWDIPKEKVIDGGAGRDGIPSINNPKFVPLGDVNYILDTDLVLVLSEGEITHIYPHKILDYHEAVNDDIQANNTTITYCPLTGTGIGFKGLINGSKTTFGISGLVYKNNQILFDRLTDSYWSQITRKAVHGTLRGRLAKTTTLFETTWKTAKSLIPNALVLSKDTGFSRVYEQFPYLDYRTNHEFLIFPVEEEDDRLKAKERVYAVLGSIDIRTYPLDHFDDNISVINDFFEGESLILIGSQKGKFITGFIRESGIDYTPLQDQFPLVFEDSNGNKYDVLGRTLEGPDLGKKLKQPDAMMGYWFALVDFFGRPQIHVK